MNARASSPLIYFAPVEKGGLFDYAIEQVIALDQLGHKIVCVGPSDLKSALFARNCKLEFVDLPRKSSSNSKIGRLFGAIIDSRTNVNILTNTIRRFRAKHVLFTSFAEYFAPFWAPRLNALRKKGVIFGVVVHDPIRDFILGPKWWHQRSIRAAYSFIDVAFVHDETPIENYNAKRKPLVVVIPHGIYRFPIPPIRSTRNEIVESLGIPKSAIVVLSFGHIRDGKNLDLLLNAIKDMSDLHVLIVGKEQSGSQKPITHYQSMAKALGVDSRCHWCHDFIEREEVWKYFEVSNYVALTYSSEFRSASGVLNTAAQFEKPIIASSGGGPLESIVQTFDLGIWVSPDSQENLNNGLVQLLSLKKPCKWREYRDANSWRSNAKTLIEHLTGNTQS